ncbi:MAG: flagellar hook capping FlgD N-terminal domain-containing protein [Sphaerobacter thermophilus]|uniref:Basal-body rod modification protein FlgD n=1 Tax=Sphaerobacter thermophilus (strain ATCC 49802 / DSM 20745 / KCCM 41009 / NCIMB 13125 / S 6022) TaxID=479434 RepID=D1C163_SPHTD|nr:flagellar hook capping FlgD N-terminal domain-containing protein [Sphaerobacter thermophilus]ACZ37980.1 flagellar hook capping protein [Sphaerobacter thermophilus DSM 20745]
MSVPGVTNQTNPGTDAASSTTFSPADRLGKQEFLMLLTAQLRNQDPLRPMEDTEFIAQLAQLNSLEQMQQMNETLSTLVEMSVLAQTASLIGRHVTALDPSGGGVIKGVVSDVTIHEGTPVLNVGGTAVPLAHVVSIGIDPSATASGGAA